MARKGEVHIGERFELDEEQILHDEVGAKVLMDHQIIPENGDWNLALDVKAFSFEFER